VWSSSTRPIAESCIHADTGNLGRAATASLSVRKPRAAATCRRRGLQRSIDEGIGLPQCDEGRSWAVGGRGHRSVAIPIARAILLQGTNPIVRQLGFRGSTRTGDWSPKIVGVAIWTMCSAPSWTGASARQTWIGHQNQ